LAFAKAAATGPQSTYAFCLTLLHTGARISEALALTPSHLDSGVGAVVLLTLKKRRPGVYRVVPVPALVLEEMAIMSRKNGCRPTERLWAWSRTTAWKEIKAVMHAARIDGPHASPKGLRHGFGVAAVQAGVPLNLVSRWLGHSSLATTAIYADALGSEERALAEKLWHVTGVGTPRAMSPPAAQDS